MLGNGGNEAMKVGLVGAATFPDEEFQEGWEYWGINNCFRDFKRCKFTRWFDIHKFSQRGRQWYRRSSATYPLWGKPVSVRRYLGALDKLGIPVYMQEFNPIVEQAVSFPFEELMQHFGTSYFGCSFAWMIALAIQEGATDIALHGIALSGPEYYYQRPSVEFFLGFAMAQGIVIHNHPSSQMLRAPWVYAYNERFDVIDGIYGRNMNALVTEMTICAQQYAMRLIEGGRK
jgi:hypothetical protein